MCLLLVGRNYTSAGGFAAGLYVPEAVTNTFLPNTSALFTALRCSGSKFWEAWQHQVNLVSRPNSFCSPEWHHSSRHID